MNNYGINDTNYYYFGLYNGIIIYVFSNFLTTIPIGIFTSVLNCVSLFYCLDL